MPLKVIARNGIMYIRGAAGPPKSRRRVYESAGTRDRARAEAKAAQIERQIWDEAVFGKKAVVTYAECAASYLEKRRPGPRDAWCIGRLVEHFGTKRLIEVAGEGAQEHLDGAILALAGNLSPGTQIRKVVIPHTAVLNHGARRSWCSSPRFERPKQQAGRTDWLHPDEAVRLVEGAAKHLKPLLLFLLGTGARVGEALALPWTDVDLKAGTAIFRNVADERRTKSGKDRPVSLPPTVVVALANLPHRDGLVFRTHGTRAKPLGEPYAPKQGEGGGQFKKAWRTACIAAGLSKTVGEGDKARVVARVSPHCLRHTWATYFQAATRDPIRLRDEGGWSTVSLVERYAHQMKQDEVPEIAKVWGVAHPDDFPANRRAEVVQVAQAMAKSS